METIKLNAGVKSHLVKNEERGIVILLNKWFALQAEKFEATGFGMMAMYITIQSCLGSIACMYILQNNASVFYLALCAAITMGCNAVFIAQGTAKWCIGAFYLSVLANTAMIVMNI